MPRIPSRLRSAVLFSLIMLFMTGCASDLSLLREGERPPATDGLLLRTRDDARMFFRDEEWKLTTTGIAGRAWITTTDGAAFHADTTLSYFDADAASGTGRTTTMKQFLLTILGVILVIGLAAIILYAAFLATDR